MADYEFLPMELVYLILDQLAGDPITLGKCSRVCRTWKGPSQAALFENVDLRLAVTRSGFDRVVHIPPHIGSMIRVISMVLEQPYFMSTLETAETLGVFAPFPKVHTLNVILRVWKFRTGKWLQKHLTPILMLPHLQTIVLSGWRMSDAPNDMKLLELLRDTPSLKVLELIDVSIEFENHLSSEGNTAGTSGLSAKGLHHLTILPRRLTNNQTALQCLLSPFNLANLTGLCISHGQSYLHEILGSTPVLERLILTSIDTDISKDPVDLSGISKTLLSVVFEFYPAFIFPFHPHLPTWIKKTLETLPTSNILNKCQFNLFIIRHTFLDYAFPRITWINAWSDLVGHFVAERFAQLERLGITILCPVGSSFQFKDITLTAEAMNEVTAEGIKSPCQHSSPPFTIELFHGPLPLHFMI